MKKTYHRKRMMKIKFQNNLNQLFNYEKKQIHAATSRYFARSYWVIGYLHHTKSQREFRTQLTHFKTSSHRKYFECNG